MASPLRAARRRPDSPCGAVLLGQDYTARRTRLSCASVMRGWSRTHVDLEVSVTAVNHPAPVFPQEPVTGQPVDRATPAARAKGRTDVLGAYIALTKPRIVELLLLTTVPVMFLADRGVPSVPLVLATVVGGTLAAGSANTLNCVLDRDIDEQMMRTRRRPLPRHQVSSRSALVFGLTLGLVATLLLGFAVNWLSALLALAANVFYVLGYTLLLKRRTSQNIVWGGAAGCFPALIGWTAVTGSLAWPPVVLFLVVFFWTPPHFWSLAIRYRADYAAADVPMLPVVATSFEVGRQIVAYSWATVITSLLLWPVASTGWFYPVVAAVLGGVLLLESYALWQRARSTEDPVALRPMRLFHFSNAYLALLFLAVAIDPLLMR
jgi:protoheme IX farnesyltransferase